MTFPPPNRPPYGGDPYGHLAPTSPAAPPPRRTGAGKIVLIVLAVVGVICLAGVIAAAIAGDGGNPGDRTAQQVQDDANRRAAAAATSSPTPAATTPPTTAPTTTTKAPPPVKTTPPPVELTDGVYIIGEDAPAGRYKVTERAGSMCYWSRTDADDSNDIKDNHLGGGFPSFTARRGEAVEISNCPPFRKVK